MRLIAQRVDEELGASSSAVFDRFTSSLDLHGQHADDTHGVPDEHDDDEEHGARWIVGNERCCRTADRRVHRRCNDDTIEHLSRFTRLPCR